MKAIRFKNVSEFYKVKFIINSKEKWEDFSALKDINFEIDKGEIVCIIGENGAGKTTLLKIIAGLLKPDSGEVFIEGRVLGIIEPGVGLQMEMTGRENINLNASLFGLRKRQIDALIDKIIEFAGLDRFIDAQVKVYSQGMILRLAFAIAIHMEPDILLIDDMINVGDTEFRRKCSDKILELRGKGKTIIFVTHDLTAARDFCSRGIILKNGMLIKDGFIDEVINYYLRTIGDKQGIAILQNNPLEVIFNNGKLSLQWRDKILTKHHSGYSVILYKDRRRSSFEAKWQVKLLSPTRIVVKGKWTTAPLEQEWDINIIDNAEIALNVITRCESVLQEAMVSIMLSSDYSRWFTPQAEGNLMHIPADKNNWEAVNCPKEEILAVGADIKELPAVILDLSDNAGRYCDLFQTDAGLNCCVMRSGFFNTGNSTYLFSGRIKILESNDKAKHYIKARTETNITQFGQWKIFAGMNKTQFYWQNNEALKSPGLYLHFSFKGKKYFSTHAKFVVENNGDELLITLSWDDVCFKQIWKLKIEDDGVIAWDIYLDADADVQIDGKEIGMLAKDAYGEWFTDNEQGKFLTVMPGVPLTNYKNNAIGLKSYENSRLFNEVCFMLEDSIPRLSYICKNGSDKDSFIRLCYLDSNAADYTHFKKGRNNYFKGRIKISTRYNSSHAKSRLQLTSPESKKGNKSISISCKELRLVFDNGKGRLLWKGNEITCGLGLYTSLYSLNNWRDSLQAFWEIKDRTETQLVLEGYWAHLPVKQRWELELTDRNCINWKVWLEFRDDLKFERAEINVMLSDKYAEWFADEKNGKFWQKVINSAERQQPIYSTPSTGGIGMKKCYFQKGLFNRQHLPFISFDCSVSNNGYIAAINNSEAAFKGRLLQYFMGGEGYSKGKEIIKNNRYFEGRIRVWE